MDRKYNIYNSPLELADSFAEELVNRINVALGNKSSFTMAISGGRTPGLLFSVIAEKYSAAVEWRKIKLFWVDERCVSPDDPESNYGMTEQILLRKIRMPSCNIFRIRGEEDPLQEASRYSQLISEHTRIKNHFPVFDLIMLGMGEDGHTASIFPGSEELLTSEKICDTAVHPETGQMRITITGKVINNSDAIFILVTGQTKAGIVRSILSDSEDAGNYPAAHIKSVNGTVTWLLDKDAAKYIL